MAQVLRHLKPSALSTVQGRSHRAHLLVGLDTGDDAAVWKIDAKTALISTVDFFTPVVDDPWTFGRIAAANALSDVYAMGGTPLFALNLVGFPATGDAKLPLAVLGRILEGGADAAREAGCAIVGGHSIDDPEPKYGLAVTGRVDPKRVLRNGGARPGDVLVLTKPLGVGVLATAIKRDLGAPADRARAERQMAALNRKAGEAIAAARPHALTDVTGFGLLGHLLGVLKNSRAGARLRLADVPVLPGARALAEAGCVPGGTRANLAFYGDRVRFGAGVAEVDRLILADAQTNGGLLASLPVKQAALLVRALRRRGVDGFVIGEIVRGPPVVEVV